MEKVKDAIAIEEESVESLHFLSLEKKGLLQGTDGGQNG